MLVLALVVSIFLFFFHHFLVNTRKLPPGPTIWLLWRRRALFQKMPHVALAELGKSYGPLLSLRLGSQLVVVASSPATAKEIHKTNNQIFSGRYLPSVYYRTPGTERASLTMARDCNETWKFLRGIGQESVFSFKAIEAASSIRKAKVGEMVKTLEIGKKVNIEEVILVAFTNIISNILISRDLFGTGGEGERGEKVMEFLNELIEKATVLGVSDMFPVLKRVDFWSRGKAMEIYRNVKFIWGDFITERRANHEENGNSRQDVLDVLIGHSFPDDEIGILLTELLSTGTESTAISTVWLMAELIKNPEILLKVRNEIAENAVNEEDKELNETLLSTCPFFQACIKETLRLHVPSPLGVPRRAIKTCTVNNRTIPIDSIVLVNSWAIQMDPTIWEDPTTFKPERFLDSAIDFKGAHFEFLPFSAGKRMCPGSNMAVKGVQFVAASLVHYFDWTLPDGDDPTQLDTSDKFGTSLRMEKPPYLIPKAARKSTVSSSHVY